MNQVHLATAQAAEAFCILHSVSFRRFNLSPQALLPHAFHKSPFSFWSLSLLQAITRVDKLMENNRVKSP